MNIEKQIEYWKTTALSDIETAEILISKNKFKEGLFFCHLTIEKILKAHYVNLLKKVAPKSHNLIYFKNILSFQFSEKQHDFLTFLMKYQLEGRYPDYFIKPLEKKEAEIAFNDTKELLLWLIKEL